MTANNLPSTAAQGELETLRRRVVELEGQLSGSALLDPYAPFFERALAMLCVASFDGYFIRLNPIWEQVLGYSNAELLATPFLDFVHPDDREATIAAAGQLARAGTDVIAFENRYRCKDGSYRVLRWHSTLLVEAGMIYAVVQDVTQHREAEERTRVYQETVNSMQTGLIVLQLAQVDDPTSLRLLTANPAARDFTGIDAEAAAAAGRRLVEVLPEAIELGLAEIYTRLACEGGIYNLGEVSNSASTLPNSCFAVRAFGLPQHRVCVTFENVTERKQAEAALRQSMLQDEVIQAQAAALPELSTPLIPVSDKVVVMPLIGSVDSRRAQQVMETLLSGIENSRVEVAILDITGVSVVDTQVANVFIQAAQAVRLLGAKVMLTGIRPEVAQTLVGLGVDLSGIITSSSLQSGIAMALGQRTR